MTHDGDAVPERALLRLSKERSVVTLFDPTEMMHHFGLFIL